MVEPTHTSSHHCAWEGCPNEGVYRAPVSRKELKKFNWFCLGHIREYNASWDFFSGMSPKEIEEFQRGAILGHRSTSKMGLNGYLDAQMLQAKIAEMFGDAQQAPQPLALPEPVRKALDTLHLSFPVTREEIKIRYKVLVKRYHPDVNKEDQHAEQTFIVIGEAYHYLMKCGHFE